MRCCRNDGRPCFARSVTCTGCRPLWTGRLAWGADERASGTRRFRPALRLLPPHPPVRTSVSCSPFFGRGFFGRGFLVRPEPLRMRKLHGVGELQCVIPRSLPSTRSSPPDSVIGPPDHRAIAFSSAGPGRSRKLRLASITQAGRSPQVAGLPGRALRAPAPQILPVAQRRSRS